MGIFNTPVGVVRKTRIFVSPTRDGRQLTIYENFVKVTGGTSPCYGYNADRCERADVEAAAKLERSRKNAMILPVPLVWGNTIEPVDISKTGFNFDNCMDCFPTCTYALHRVYPPLL